MARTYREVVSLLVLLMLVSLGSCDITQDKNECLNQLVGLSTCLPYVGGNAKMPTKDCCAGLDQVINHSKKCLCILVKDRNDPSIGLKINSTLALGLPVKCNSAHTSVADCPALLHLAPNSPDAKVFSDFAKQAAGMSADSSTPASSAKPSDSTTSTTSAKGPSNDGSGKRWLLVQVLYGVFLWCFTLHFAF